MTDDPFLFSRLAWTVAQRMPQPKRGGRVLLVTSAARGEGKSYVAELLATALAEQLGGSVALVACSDSPGPRASAPAGAATWSDILRNGVAEPPPASLFASSPREPVNRIAYGDGQATLVFRADAIFRAIDGLRNRSNFIVLDGPVLANCGVLGASTDAGLLVINAARTQRETVKASLGSNRSTARKLVGTVLNQKPNYLPRWLRRADS